MAEELRKSVFNEGLITHLSDAFSHEMSSFDKKVFHELVFSTGLGRLSAERAHEKNYAFHA